MRTAFAFVRFAVRFRARGAFKSKDVAKGAVPGAKMDLWLYTQVNGHRVVGFDVVPVETSSVKADGASRDGKHLL